MVHRGKHEHITDNETGEYTIDTSRAWDYLTFVLVCAGVLLVIWLYLELRKPKYDHGDDEADGPEEAEPLKASECSVVQSEDTNPYKEKKKSILGEGLVGKVVRTETVQPVLPSLDEYIQSNPKRTDRLLSRSTGLERSDSFASLRSSDSFASVQSDRSIAVRKQAEIKAQHSLDSTDAPQQGSSVPAAVAEAPRKLSISHEILPAITASPQMEEEKPQKSRRLSALSLSLPTLTGSATSLTGKTAFVQPKMKNPARTAFDLELAFDGNTGTVRCVLKQVRQSKLTYLTGVWLDIQLVQYEEKRKTTTDAADGKYKPPKKNATDADDEAEDDRRVIQRKKCGRKFYSFRWGKLPMSIQFPNLKLTETELRQFCLRVEFYARGLTEMADKGDLLANYEVSLGSTNLNNLMFSKTFNMPAFNK